MMVQDAQHRQIAPCLRPARAGEPAWASQTSIPGADAMEALERLRGGFQQARPRGLSRSPRCGEMTTREPKPSASVTFIWPPSASTGSASGRGQHMLQRRTAAPQTQRPGFSGDDPHDPVIRRPQDGPVVVQERVGDRCEALLRLGLVGQNGLAADVARRRDQRSAERIGDQVVQRTVGQKRAEFRKPRGESRRQTAVRTERHKDDRVLGAAQTARFVCVRRAVAAEHVQQVGSGAGEQHGQRLAGPPFARAQAADRGVVAGIAQQVIAADALDGDDRAIAQGRNSADDRLLGCRGRCAIRS